MTALLTKLDHEEMHRRQREIEHMIADLGLTHTGFRTDGNSHWRLDVKAPNGRQRPFTFSTRGHDGARRHVERAQVRRWRDEVWPEGIELENAGKLKKAPELESPLAHALREKAGHLVRDTVSELRATSIIGDASHAPPPTQQTKEQPMREVMTLSQVRPPVPPPMPHPANDDGTTERVKRITLSPRDNIRLADWLRAPGRLDEPTTRAILAEKATAELGTTVTEYHVRTLIESLELEIIPIKKVRSDKGSTRDFGALNDDVATIAMALAECESMAQHHKDALLAIVERRTRA